MLGSPPPLPNQFPWGNGSSDALIHGCQRSCDSPANNVDSTKNVAHCTLCTALLHKTASVQCKKRCDCNSQPPYSMYSLVYSTYVHTLSTFKFCSRFTVPLRRSFLRPLRFKSSCQIRPSSRAQISCNVMSSLLSINSLALFFVFLLHISHVKIVYIIFKAH